MFESWVKKKKKVNGKVSVTVQLFQRWNCNLEQTAIIFPRSSREKNRRKGKCNRAEMAAKPGMLLLALARKKPVLSKGNKQ